MIWIGLLRGVNLGNRRVSMQALRAACESVGLDDVQTLVQSGNLVFHSNGSDRTRLAKSIANSIQKEFGFRTDVFLLTPQEMRAIVERCPFRDREGLDGAKLAVIFLADAPDGVSLARLAAIQDIPEELRVGERELFVYYTNGMGRPILTPALLDKALGKMSCTTRNWNTVTKLLAMAEAAAAKP